MKRKLPIIAVLLLLVSGSSTGNAQAQTRGELLAPGPFEPHEYADYTAMIADSLASGFNRVLSLPEPIVLSSERCGEVNAYYFRQDDGTPQITMCAEMVADIRQEFSGNQLRNTDFKSAVGSTVLFIYLHELGHALIDVLDLPAVGNEEIAADQIATLLMQEYDRGAYWAAQYWMDSDNPGDIRILKGLFRSLGDIVVASNSFADDHSLDKQRFYDILCWTYGADPVTRQYMVGPQGLPPDRARSCKRDFNDVERSWDTLLDPHLKGEGFQKDDTRQGGTGLAGKWSFQEQFHAENRDISCRSQGTLTLRAPDSRSNNGEMDQEGACRISGVEVDNSGTQPVTELTRDSNNISFKVGDCIYTGKLTSPKTISSGEVSCNPTIDGDYTVLTGTWSASRK